MGQKKFEQFLENPGSGVYNIICIMHTYFDLISLPLSYLNFPHLSFFVQAWVFIQQFRHVQDAHSRAFAIILYLFMKFVVQNSQRWS